MDDAIGERERAAERQFERLVFFSDAVFAIAITVLVLDLKAPRGPHGEPQLRASVSDVIGFLISFAVIGRYWLAHHALFGALRREDGPLRTVNLVYLASIAFLPFPTSVLETFTASATTVIFYALSVATVGLLQVALCLVARRPALMRTGQTRGGTALAVAQSVPAPAIFLASTLVALVSPRAAMYLWIAIWPASRLGDWVGEKVRRRIDGLTVHAAST
jgi:uncharacterized membrane protein